MLGGLLTLCTVKGRQLDSIVEQPFAHCQLRKIRTQLGNDTRPFIKSGKLGNRAKFAWKKFLACSPILTHYPALSYGTKQLPTRHAEPRVVPNLRFCTVKQETIYICHRQTCLSQWQALTTVGRVALAGIKSNNTSYILAKCKPFDRPHWNH